MSMYEIALELGLEADALEAVLAASAQDLADIGGLGTLFG